MAPQRDRLLNDGECARMDTMLSQMLAELRGAELVGLRRLCWREDDGYYEYASLLRLFIWQTSFALTLTRGFLVGRSVEENVKGLLQKLGRPI